MLRIGIGKKIIVIGSGIAAFELCRILSKSEYELSVLEIGGLNVDRDLQQREGLTYTGKKVKPGGFDLNSHLPDSYLGLSWVKELGGTLNMWSGKWKKLSTSVLEDWGDFCGDPKLLDEINASYWDVATAYNIPLEVMQREEEPAPPFLKHYEENPPLRIKQSWIDLDAKNENIQLHTGTKVLNVRRAEGQYIVNTINEEGPKDFFADQVVVAAGGIESPRILLRSKEVAAKLPALGNYYMDHPKRIVGELKPTHKLKEVFFNKTSNKSIGVSIPLPPSYLESVGPHCHHCMYLVPKYYTSLKILAFMEGHKQLHWAYRGQRFLINAVSRKFKMIQSFRLFLNLEQPPCKQSRLTISNEESRDELNWKFTTDFEALTNKWLSEFSRFAVDNGYGAVELSSNYLSINDLHEASHPMGMSRISKDASLGVVDSNLEVHNNPSLYVVSSSVFPFSGSANPTFTIVALANRLAKMIISNKE